MVDRRPVYGVPCHLRRIAAANNVWRYYTLTLWPDLFGGTTLVREWGRIGQDGTVMRRHFTDEASARRELDRVARSKVHRRHRPVDAQDRRAARPDARPANVTYTDPWRLAHARNAQSSVAGGLDGARPCAATRHAMRESQATVDQSAEAAAACRG